MSATPLSYVNNTSTLANYLNVVKIPDQEKTQMKLAAQQDKKVYVDEILKYNKYPNEQELPLDEFKDTASRCQVYYNEQNNQFPMYKFASN
jgi:hypothetical protein